MISISDDEILAEPIQFDDLRRRKAKLEQRLEDGYVRINDAEAEGRDVSAWEELWMTLLHEYESVCNDLLDAA
jgi:hypothetical protein